MSGHTLVPWFFSSKGWHPLSWHTRIKVVGAAGPGEGDGGMKVHQVWARTLAWLVNTQKCIFSSQVSLIPAGIRYYPAITMSEQFLEVLLLLFWFCLSFIIILKKYFFKKIHIYIYIHIYKNQPHPQALYSWFWAGSCGQKYRTVHLLNEPNYTQRNLSYRYPEIVKCGHKKPVLQKEQKATQKTCLFNGRF